MKVMYIIGGVCICIFLLGFYLARDEPYEGKNGLKKPFLKLAYYLYRIFCERGIMPDKPGGGLTAAVRKIGQSLQSLHPGESPEKLYREYYSEKLALSLMVCFAGTLLGCLLSVKAYSEAGISDGSIKRYGFERKGKEPAGMDIELEGIFAEERQRFYLEVGSRVLLPTELDEYFEELCKVLPERILGANECLDQVSLDLRLEDSYEDFPFDLDWNSSDWSLISPEGEVAEVEEAQDCMLTVEVTYGEWRSVYEVPVRLVPKVLSAEEERYRVRQQILTESEALSRTSADWVLPHSIQDDAVRWRRVVKDYGTRAWILSLGVAGLIFFLADKDLQDQLEKRRQLLGRDYPEIVHKLVLYMGAGMTARGSIRKIVENHTEAHGGNLQSAPVYEELLMACRELQTGVSEKEVYDHLGRRLGVREYIRLTTLLSQNLKKGNSTLLQRLEEEAERAGELRLQYARKHGEEAGTKLLVPMVLFLLVVMVIMVLPAFWAVGL